MLTDLFLVEFSRCLNLLRKLLFHGLKTLVFDDFKLGNMAFFKPILDFSLKIWLFIDHESGNKNKNKPIDQSMA